MDGDEKSEAIIGVWKMVAAGSELSARLGPTVVQGTFDVDAEYRVYLLEQTTRIQTK